MRSEPMLVDAEAPFLAQRYSLLSCLFEDEHRQVSLALDTRECRVVALKVTKQTVVEEWAAEEVADLIGTIEQEAVLLAQLQHPSLPRLYDSFDDEEGWYLVTEFIDGYGLGAWLHAVHEEVLSGEPGLAPLLLLQKILAVGIQLAAALAYMHARAAAVVHRDVKPGNALVTPQGRVVLIDLGIACVLAPGEAGMVRFGGTQGFCAPEQQLWGWSSPQGDLYSLGVVLSGLLVGRIRPPDAEGPFVPPAAIQPQALRDLLVEMTRRDLWRRLRSAGEVAQELRRILESVVGGACDDARIQGLLVTPHVTYAARGLASTCYQGQTLWYLYRPASRTRPRLDVLAKVVYVPRCPESPYAEIAFTHPHTGKEERRWVPPRQMWRLGALG